MHRLAHITHRSCLAFGVLQITALATVFLHTKITNKKMPGTGVPGKKQTLMGHSL